MPACSQSVRIVSFDEASQSNDYSRVPVLLAQQPGTVQTRFQEESSTIRCRAETCSLPARVMDLCDHLGVRLGVLPLQHCLTCTDSASLSLFDFTL